MQRSVPPTTPDQPAATTEPTVLIVDDDAVLRSFLADLLVEEGYRVVAADDGAAALALLATTAPRLILLDTYMPVMDGLTFLRAYKALPAPHAPVLVLSADAGATAEEASSLGAEALLPKPFELDELLELVRRVARSGGA